MLIMTGEEDERRPSEDGTPTHTRRRRWSTPIDSGGESLHDHDSFTVRSLETNRENGGVDESISCSANNSYSFYLGEKISPWGPSSGPPLLTESRSIARRRGRSVTRKRDLPPFLTTLDCNGRPRFHHRRVRSEGRLEIASVAVDSPEIISVRGREGLRIGTLRISQQHQQGDDDQQIH
ncbi:uncharacterized protein LOC18020290 [Eutrema salsugineum]|nr:uncharacterized protein LOC18020290 [Eutrema salsugineum]